MQNTWLNESLDKPTAEIENTILAEILITKRMIPDLLPEYFTSGRRKLYDAIFASWSAGNEIDPIFLKTIYPDQVSNALDYAGSDSADIIQSLHTLWQEREAASVILSARAENDTPEMFIAKIQEGMANILIKNRDKKYNHIAIVQKLNDIIINGDKNKCETLGYKSGLTEFDRYTSGFEKGKMYAIGALKKTGKSRFSIYLSLKIAQQGAGIIWNSLEMNEIQLNACALSNLSGIDQAKFGRTMIPEIMSQVQAGINSLVNLDWKIIHEKTIAGLRAQIINIKTQNQVDVVFVDYIQRMEDPNRKHDRVREVEAIAKGLADLSRELDIAVVVLSQFAGTAEHLADNELPNMSHLKESQGIAEAADCIISLHNFKRRENPFDMTGSYSLQEINCLIEQRYGLSGASFKFLGDMRNCQFVNHEKPYG